MFAMRVERSFHLAQQAFGEVPQFRIRGDLTHDFLLTCHVFFFGGYVLLDCHKVLGREHHPLNEPIAHRVPGDSNRRHFAARARSDTAHPAEADLASVRGARLALNMYSNDALASARIAAARNGAPGKSIGAPLDEK
jgi:hypothetical protein